MPCGQDAVVARRIIIQDTCYKSVGATTEELASETQGRTLHALMSLGRGYNTTIHRVSLTTTKQSSQIALILAHVSKAIIGSGVVELDPGITSCLWSPFLPLSLCAPFSVRMLPLYCLRTGLIVMAAPINTGRAGDKLPDGAVDGGHFQHVLTPRAAHELDHQIIYC